MPLNGAAGVQSPIGGERRASPWLLLPVQSCFSKPSWATRLNASAATVLSRRGAVKPQVQLEQHQPANVSSSIQIMRLFIGCAQFWISTEGWTSAGDEGQEYT
jgi:hypothetical protein